MYIYTLTTLTQKSVFEFPKKKKNTIANFYQIKLKKIQLHSTYTNTKKHEYVNKLNIIINKNNYIVNIKEKKYKSLKVTFGKSQHNNIFITPKYYYYINFGLYFYSNNNNNSKINKTKNLLLLKV